MNGISLIGSALWLRRLAAVEQSWASLAWASKPEAEPLETYCRVTVGATATGPPPILTRTTTSREGVTGVGCSRCADFA